MAYKINGSTVIDDNRNLFVNSLNLNGNVITTAPGSGADPLAEIKTHSIGALLQTLNNPNAYGTSGGDNFSYTVDISGTKCIVGAYYEYKIGGGLNPGKAYIFDVTTGALLQTLNNPNAYSTSVGDQFGSSVAISGNKCIVGAQPEDDSGGTDSGKAYIFDVTTGSLLQTLNNPNAYGTSASDYFGSRVAISGNYCIVGAYQEDDSGGTDSGKAYIFDLNNNQTVIEKLLNLGGL